MTGHWVMGGHGVLFRNDGVLCRASRGTRVYGERGFAPCMDSACARTGSYPVQCVDSARQGGYHRMCRFWARLGSMVRRLWAPPGSFLLPPPLEGSVGFFYAHGVLQSSIGRVPGKADLTTRPWQAMGGGNIRGMKGAGVRQIRGRKRCAETQFRSRRFSSVAERLSALPRRECRGKGNS